MGERSIPPQLAVLNSNLKRVFGEKYASIFMTTTPAELLFNGIPLCVNSSGLAKAICSVIKKQKPKAIAVMEDGSMRFSMFGFVSILQVFFPSFCLLWFHSEYEFKLKTKTNVV